MSLLTKFELNLISCLSENMPKLLDKSEVRKMQEFSGA